MHMMPTNKNKNKDNSCEPSNYQMLGVGEDMARGMSQCIDWLTYITTEESK